MCLQQAQRTVSHCAAFQYLVPDLSYPSVISLFADTTSPPCTRLVFKPFITSTVSSASSSTWHRTLLDGLMLPRTVLSSAAPSSPNSRVCVDFLSSVSFLLPSSHCPAGIPSPTLLLLQVAAPPVGQEAGIALGVLRGALGHCSLCPSGLKVQIVCRKVPLSPCGTCPGFELSSVWGRGTGGTRGAAPTSLQQQGTGLRRASPFADEVLVELLEADGLEDAVLVILAGEQGNRQGLGPSPSGRGDLSPPGTARIPACRPALVWRRSGKTKSRAEPQQGAAVWPALG